MDDDDPGELPTLPRPGLDESRVKPGEWFESTARDLTLDDLYAECSSFAHVMGRQLKIAKRDPVRGIIFKCCHKTVNDIKCGYRVSAHVKDKQVPVQDPNSPETHFISKPTVFVRKGTSLLHTCEQGNGGRKRSYDSKLLMKSAHGYAPVGGRQQGQSRQSKRKKQNPTKSTEISSCHYLEFVAPQKVEVKETILPSVQGQSIHALGAQCWSICSLLPSDEMQANTSHFDNFKRFIQH